MTPSAIGAKVEYVDAYGDPRGRGTVTARTKSGRVWVTLTHNEHGRPFANPRPVLTKEKNLRLCP